MRQLLAGILLLTFSFSRGMNAGAGSSERDRAPGHKLLLAFATVFAAALWIIFVNSSNPHEMILGLVSVCGTMVFVYSVARTFRVPMELRSRDFAEAWRLPWYVLSGVVEITWVLIKDLLHIQPAENLFCVAGFDSSKHDPLRIMRTVLAVSYTTMSPNFIVIGIDPAQSRMLFHQISRTSVMRLTKNLGAKG